MLLGEYIRQKYAKMSYRNIDEFKQDLNQHQMADIGRAALSGAGGLYAGSLIAGVGGTPLAKVLGVGGALGTSYLISKLIRDKQIEQAKKEKNLARQMYLNQPVLSKESLMALGINLLPEAIDVDGIKSLTPHRRMLISGALAGLTPLTEKSLVAGRLYNEYKNR